MTNLRYMPALTTAHDEQREQQHNYSLKALAAPGQTNYFSTLELRFTKCQRVTPLKSGGYLDPKPMHIDNP